MTDTEYKTNIKNISSDELVNSLIYFGTDMYYYDLWKSTVNEIARRLGVDRRVE